MTFYPEFSEGVGAEDAGTQLLAHVYIPPGFVGFVKELTVCPYIPSILTHPWLTSGATGQQASWQDFDVSANGFNWWPRAPEVHGYWQTPMAWESYFEDPNTSPAWRWSLRLSQGDAVTLRETQPPFDPLDDTTWRWLPSIPVPSDPTYRGGLPGTAPGPRWDAQRYQVTPDSSFRTHVRVEEDTTISLWAQWTQAELVAGRAADWNGQIEYSQILPFYPLLPSFGMLAGYMQRLNSPPHPPGSVNAAGQNSMFGWGG